MFVPTAPLPAGRLPLPALAAAASRAQAELIAKASGRGIVKPMLNKTAGLDRAFHALSDPTRRALLARLSRGPTSVSELARPLSMSLSAVVQHLAVLEGSGLVRSQKQGRVRTCEVDAQALRQVEQWLGQRRAEWERSLDRLAGYLATLHAE